VVEGVPSHDEVMEVQCGGATKSFAMSLAGKAQFGPGVSRNVGEIARKLGVSSAVLVTDATMEQLGMAERISGYLHDAGVECCIFAGVEPEPSVETTDAVAELAREHDCRLVVGLGGGSCMDVAKAVSVLITNTGSAGQYQGLGLVPNKGVPKIMIPTTAGTGSEVTFTAVLIRKSDGVKGGINDEKLFPDCQSSRSQISPCRCRRPSRHRRGWTRSRTRSKPSRADRRPRSAICSPARRSAGSESICASRRSTEGIARRGKT